MNCYNHLERPAVGQCTRCGKFLCKECTVEASTVLCRNCYGYSYNEYQANIEQDRRNQKNNITLSSIVFIISCSIILLMYVLGIGKFYPITLIPASIWGLALAGIPYGWRKLNGTKLNVILVLPLIGWIIYVAIKLQVSCWFGWFLFIKDILDYRKNKQM